MVRVLQKRDENMGDFGKAEARSDCLGDAWLSPDQSFIYSWELAGVGHIACEICIRKYYMLPSANVIH